MNFTRCRNFSSSRERFSYISSCQLSPWVSVAALNWCSSAFILIWLHVNVTLGFCSIAVQPQRTKIGQINLNDRMVPYVSLASLCVQLRGAEVNRAHMFGIALRNVVELITGK